LTAQILRFKDLKPAGMESNIFMYHLKALIKEGYIIKMDIGYTLTSKGKHYVDRTNLDSLIIRIQPKSITIIYVENEQGKMAILERLHQPFIGYKGFPSGKIHYGESLDQSATRELYEKTGLVNKQLKLRGTFIMKFRNNKEIVNHIIGYVFAGVAPIKEELDYHNKYFRSYWGDKSELYQDNRFKGHPELFELLETTNPDRLFFAEHEFTSDF
ncbi:MAG: NUDIX hydrolase, partial [Patescibacteria group bacterium]|nr:NUDIX hydrolase [Patescibacteria group bacterium]